MGGQGTGWICDEKAGRRRILVYRVSEYPHGSSRPVPVRDPCGLSQVRHARHAVPAAVSRARQADPYVRGGGGGGARFLIGGRTLLGFVFQRVRLLTLVFSRSSRYLSAGRRDAPSPPES